PRSVSCSTGLERGDQAKRRAAGGPTSAGRKPYLAAVPHLLGASGGWSPCRPYCRHPGLWLSPLFNGVFGGGAKSAFKRHLRPFGLRGGPPLPGFRLVRRDIARGRRPPSGLLDSPTRYSHVKKNASHPHSAATAA